MRFLIDADLPRRSAALIAQHGHFAMDVRDVDLGAAPDAEIAAFARKNDCVLVTGDFGFADVRHYPPQQCPGIIVLELPRNATAQYILRMLEGLLADPNLLVDVAGRLAVVGPNRVRYYPRH